MTGKTIIIGAGHAGGSTAGFLRKKKYAGEIVLIGQENHYPYQRPPLSKDFLTKAIEDKRLYLKSSEYYEKNSIDVLAGFKVQNINWEKKFLTLNNGKKLISIQ